MSAAPIAIGGVGGSGTRIIARLARHLGIFMGNDLNPASDNLLFTLLFKRRESLTLEPQDCQGLMSLFTKIMTTRSPLTDGDLALLTELAATPRADHDCAWLSRRVTLAQDVNRRTNPGLWGWKEPNTHVLLPSLLDHYKGLRYIHVVRNGLDMALSENQAQVALWGPCFSESIADTTPRHSLRYWCLVHRRIQEIATAYPGQVYWLDFDAFCQSPGRHLASLLAFLGAPNPGPEFGLEVSNVRVPDSLGRYQKADPDWFDPSDVCYVQSLGYPTFHHPSRLGAQPS